MSYQKTPTPSFVFYVSKPKAQRIAELFREGAMKRGYPFLLGGKDTSPRADTIGVFYGVIPATYSQFVYHRAEGRAIYLDNGWLSTADNPTFRFSWNSVQPHLADMPRPKEGVGVMPLPAISRNPRPNTALLILQTPDYFANLRLPYTRDQWQRAVTKILTDKGYVVETREKPRTKDQSGPDFFAQLETAGIVVGLNSAACLKAIRYGIPAYCTLDCTLSPHAPVKLPDAGYAAPPLPTDVRAMLLKLSTYELTREGLRNGQALDTIMSVPTDKRRGYWYGT